MSLKAREDARIDAMVKGMPFSSKEACVRMPDFISFRDLAGRIVRFGDANPQLLDGPAASLAQKTLERDFPCPPPPPKPPTPRSYPRQACPHPRSAPCTNRSRD